MNLNPLKIRSIHIRTIHRPYPKLAIHRSIGSTYDQYDVYSFRDKIDIIVELLKILDSEFENFLELFLETDLKYFKKSPHRTRHYISKDRNELYPGKDAEFTKKYSFDFKGYWIGTNIGTTEILQYAREICEACNIRYGYWDEIKL